MSTVTETVHASCGWCTTARCQGCVETRKTSRPAVDPAEAAIETIARCILAGAAETIEEDQ